MGERFNRYGKRLLLQLDETTVCSVPPQWTDLATPDPEIVMGERRALMRIADFVELARLVARLGERAAQRTVEQASMKLCRMCNLKDAALRMLSQCRTLIDSIPICAIWVDSPSSMRHHKHDT